MGCFHRHQPFRLSFKTACCVLAIMTKRIAGLIDRIRRPNRLSRFVKWLKEITDYISEQNRPIDYIVEGGPLRRGVVGVVVLTFLIGVPWVTAGEFTQTSSDRITLFSAGTSIFLTFGLLWIYLSIAQSEQTQAEFIEKQTELQQEIQSLQRDQVNIMGAEFEPVIEILDYGIGNDKPPTDPISLGDNPPHSGDFFHIEISNLTEAIATNLRLRFVLDYMGPTGYGGGADIPLSLASNDRTLTTKPGGIIQGQQVEAEYHCIAGLTLPIVGRGDMRSFSKCLSTLSDNGVSHLRIAMLLVYEDRKGKEHEIELEGFELTSSNWPDQTPTLAQVRNAGNEVPVDLVKAGLLDKGIPEIPPAYEH